MLADGWAVGNEKLAHIAGSDFRRLMAVFLLTRPGVIVNSNSNDYKC